MKTGKTLTELAQEIERQRTTKKDFVAPLSMLEMKSNGVSTIDLNHGGAMVVNSVAHEQIAEKMGIPKKYYDRMRVEAPELLDRNVNHWFKTPKKDAVGKALPVEQVLVRTLDNNVRSLLSSKYRSLDHAPFAEAVLPVLAELDLLVLSCEITERRLFIKAVDKSIERDIPTGAKMGSGHTIFNTLAPAITLSNSEVGCGSLAVLGSVFTRQCTNLATFSERSTRKYHVGARREDTESIAELLSDETKMLTDQATWAQMRDVVKAAFDRAKFDALVDKIAGSVEDKITDVIKLVDNTAKQLILRDTEKVSVLQHLIQGGDLTRYGLFNAITRTAEDVEEYDRATELEKFGGNIIDITPKDWKQLAA